MFEYISGTVDSVNASTIVIDVGGIGFEVQADAFTRSAAEKGKPMRLYTQLRLADDRLTLYGFGSPRQKDLFMKLTTVSGVGPRMALAILSGLSVDDFTSALLLDDQKALIGVPGVGKKTAQRILLEMRGKVEPTSSEELVFTQQTEGARDAAMDAVEALEELGYTRQEAAQAVSSVRTLADTPEDLVRHALKRMGLK